MDMTNSCYICVSTTKLNSANFRTLNAAVHFTSYLMYHEWHGAYMQ